MSADEGVHHHGDPALHIQRAAPPDVVILEAAFDRRDVPRLRGGGNHVDVAVKKKRWGVATPGQSTDDVEALKVVADEVGSNASIGQDVPAVRRAFSLVSGRVSGIEADQLLEEFGDG